MASHIQIGDVSPRIQYTADGVQVQFIYPFPIFEIVDLEVYVDAVKQSVGFAVVGAGNSTGGTVDFDVPPISGTTVTLARRLAIQRTSDFQESGAFRSQVINDELDYLTAALQQVSDDQGRSAQMAITESADVDTVFPSPAANTAIVWNETASGFVNGPSIEQISTAQANATNAALSATDAAASQAGAASSATAAQTAAASNMYATNEVKSANFSVLLTEDGKQFLIDTSGGPVTVTLPQGVVDADGFRIALAKTSADSNAVIVNTSGTDTINGGVTWQFSVPHGQSLLTLDTTVSPNTWFAAGVGLTAPVNVLDLHDNARPFDIAFVAGFDSTMVAEDIAVQTYGELIAPRAFTITGAQLYMDIAPVGVVAIFDVEKNGVSVFSVKPQVASAANVGTPPSNDFTLVVAGDRLTFKCTQTGTTVAGGGARFTLAGKLS